MVQAGTGRCRLEQEGVEWSRKVLTVTGRLCQNMKVQTGTGRCRMELEGADWNRKVYARTGRFSKGKDTLYSMGQMDRRVQREEKRGGHRRQKGTVGGIKGHVEKGGKREKVIFCRK